MGLSVVVTVVKDVFTYLKVKVKAGAGVGREMAGREETEIFLLLVHSPWLSQG